MVAAYFPNLCELAVDLNLGFDLGENVSFIVLGSSGLGVSRTIGETPLFFRTPEGRGIHISMSANSHPGRRWKTIKVIFMKEQEAARYNNNMRANPKNHRDFLDRLGIYLWHIFTMEGFLWGDQSVQGLLRQHRQHFLCQ